MTVVSVLLLIAVLTATFGFVVAVLCAVRAAGDREVRVSVRLFTWRVEITVK